MKNDDSNDFDFRNSLYNTLILLGCKYDIALLLKKSMDYGVTESDIEALRNYNTDLFEETKEKLTRINTAKLRVSAKGG